MKRILWASVLGLTACATTGGGGSATSTPQTPAQTWPVITRLHVDLWLHGYAMLLRDTATVPVFRRGYRDRIQAAKNQRGITTLLDANRERLQSRFALSPALINGQFAPMYFANFDQMQQVIGLFLRARGKSAGDERPDAATVLRGAELVVWHGRRPRVAAAFRRVGRR